MNQDLVTYYKDRAAEYEKIYLKPERQHDLQKATAILQALFAQKEVLEVACGTGYWTERIAETAASIFATDINQSVIDLARGKYYKNKVEFEVADIYNLAPEKQYEGVFGGFIWSHILLQDINRFVDKVKSFAAPSGTIVFMDNNYVEGSNHAIAKTDEQGNTYQSRTLENGTSHLVLKNFPTEKFLRDKLSGIAAETNFISLTYYWIVSIKLA